MTPTSPPIALTVELRDRRADRPPVARRLRRLPDWLDAMLASTPGQRLAGAALALVALGALGGFAAQGAVDARDAARRAELETLLDGHVAVLRLLLDAQRQRAQRAADSDELQQAVAELSGTRPLRLAPEATALPARTGAQRLHDVLALLANRDEGPIEVAALDGRVLASSSAARSGRLLPPADVAALQPVLAGQARWLPLVQEPVQAMVQATEGSRTVLRFAAAVRTGETVPAAVIATVRAESLVDRRAMSSMAEGAAGRWSRADVWLFDRRGMPLSGAAPGAVAATTVLREAIAAQPDRTPEDGPEKGHGSWTQASPEGSGTRLGAWRWLADVGVGTAVEIDATDAFSAAPFARLAALVFLGTLGLALTVAMTTSLPLAGMLRESRRLGPYRLEGVIEEGGMATVYRAEHALMKRPTAVKILKPHLASDELIARFQREVMLTSRLEHPATVEIYDYGLTRDGSFYFAMEYVDGLTLERLVDRDGPQPAARVAHILKQVCESLREAHAKGLVHRDVKPPNIMLCERGGESDVVKVLDWGLIKDVRSVEQRNLTQFARVLGTPDYMPPERVLDPALADARVDIYGVGAVAYFLLTGKRLFDAPNAFDLQRMIVEAEAPRAAAAAEGAVPAALDRLIARCLAKDPVRRPASVVELIDVFTAVLRADPWTPAQAAAWWSAHRIGVAGAAADRGDALA